MEKTLEKVIVNNKKGLFLLDPPTGFGKTTIVVDLIRRFLEGDQIFFGVKKIFFITNLITNLPYQTLINKLDDKHKGMCFQAKATTDYIIERFLQANVTESDVKNSKEYKKLNGEIETFYSVKKEIINNPSNAGLKNSLNIIKQTIATVSEPAFRQLIKNKFFYNKSIPDRQKFMRDNSWLIELYPICDIEKFKVIFLTTQKFISPIDTFRRIPFYAYNDKIIDDSIIFIDEFDSTKSVVLNRIIEDGIKSKIDIVSLFLDLHFALQNVTIPQKLLHTSEYHKEKVESGEWHETKWHFEHWKQRFKEIYEKHNINYLLKSVDFQYDKAFLFDDGKYFNVVKDSAKKFIYANIDHKEDVISLKGMDYSAGTTPINTIIWDIENCIDGFVRALFFVYNNYMYYKNQSKKANETRYTEEEAIYTVLDILNLNEEKKKYLFEKIQKGDYFFEKGEKDEGMRRGFNFTEIEDSNYHDMKSVVKTFSFPTTPEDVIINLTDRAMVVGISATANVKTCIGNYDIKYLEKKLGECYITPTIEDEKRIEENFNNLVRSLSGQYRINSVIVDNFDKFSDKDKCLEYIKILFKGEYEEKYASMIDDDAVKDYYFLIELKLAFLYKKIFENDIHSLIAFENRFPKTGDVFDLDRLHEMFDDIRSKNSYDEVIFEVVNAQDFDEKLNSIKSQLAQGKRVYVLTTYQTVGSGKNIQYKIPECLKHTVVCTEDDTREEKDFEAVYLATPTNLLQVLRSDSDDKYSDLAKYLFHQEYLYKNGYLTYAHMRYNIANGFRKTFFGGKDSFYPKNGDLYAHTLKIIIQAVGRICRCRNKNKNIYVFADKEVVERVECACRTNRPRLLNEEFKALLDVQTFPTIDIKKIQEYSSQSKRTHYEIKNKAWNVRRSLQAIVEWQKIRDFVLKNPTTDNPGEYKDLYFEFDNKYEGYSFSFDSKYNVVNIKFDIRENMNQVSEQACDLPLILSTKNIKKFFVENGYAIKFDKKHFIMNPSLFKQVYLGALGEVVGKYILEKEFGWDLEEIDDVSHYELFDYKLNKIYFDFKHWDMFRINNDEYVQKVQRKLNRVKGEKAIVINLIKRTDAKIKESADEMVIQVPYLIDSESGTINFKIIEEIGELIL